MTRPTDPRTAWRAVHRRARITARVVVMRGMPWASCVERAGATVVALQAGSIGPHAGHVTATRQLGHPRAECFAALDCAAVARTGGWGRVAVRHWCRHARTLRTRAGVPGALRAAA